MEIRPGWGKYETRIRGSWMPGAELQPHVEFSVVELGGFDASPTGNRVLLTFDTEALGGIIDLLKERHADLLKIREEARVFYAEQDAASSKSKDGAPPNLYTPSKWPGPSQQT